MSMDSVEVGQGDSRVIRDWIARSGERARPQQRKSASSVMVWSYARPDSIANTFNF